MEQIYERVAGLDVHRDSVSACARVPGVRREVVLHRARYATTTAGLAELADWLGSEAVTVVGMEATGVYWKPCYYALEGRFEVWPLAAPFHHHRHRAVTVSSSAPSDRRALPRLGSPQLAPAR